LLNKILSRFIDKYKCAWRNADWPASWHISTKSYQWQWKCGCSLTSWPGDHSVWLQFNVMPRTEICGRSWNILIIYLGNFDYNKLNRIDMVCKWNLPQPNSIECHCQSTNIVMYNNAIMYLSITTYAKYWLRVYAYCSTADLISSFNRKMLTLSEEVSMILVLTLTPYFTLISI